MAEQQQYPVRLESFRWSKPGVAEAVYVQMLPIAQSNASAKEQKLEGLGKGLPFSMALVGKSMRNMGVYAEMRWTYRAGKPVERSPTDRSPTGKHQEQWTMDVGLMQIPLTQHPSIIELKTSYSGIIKDGEVKFAPYMADGKVNPLYNQTDFYSPTVTLSVEYAVQSAYKPSAGDLSGLGAADMPDSGGFNFAGSAAKGRSPWLLVEKSVMKKGNDRVERKTWRYGGRAGWLDAIYKNNFFQV